MEGRKKRQRGRVLEFLRQCFLPLVKLITVSLIGFPCLCAGVIEKRSANQLG